MIRKGTQRPRVIRFGPTSKDSYMGQVKVRADHAGVGAARLYRGRCEGCRLELPPTEVAALKAAAEDEVLRCEECRCVLVRTSESGL